MANEKIKPEGITIFPKHQKAPDFVLGTAIIDIDKFNEWINHHNGYLTEYRGRSQLKLQILKGKEGGVYFQVDTYQPNSNF